MNTRNTKQKTTILEELKKVKTHPSADDIYSMVRKYLPKISLGTVYRNLENMAEQGLIQKLEYGDQKRFDGNPKPHYHFRCTNCNKLEDVPGKIFECILNETEWVKERKIEGYRLEIHGLCNKCKQVRENQ